MEKLDAMVSMTYYDTCAQERHVWKTAGEFLIDAEGTVSVREGGRLEIVAYFSEDGDLISPKPYGRNGDRWIIEDMRLETCYAERNGVEVFAQSSDGLRKIHLKGGRTVKLRLVREDVVLLRNGRDSDLTATSSGSWPGGADYLVVRPLHRDIEVVAFESHPRGRLSELAAG